LNRIVVQEEELVQVHIENNTKKELLDFNHNLIEEKEKIIIALKKRIKEDRIADAAKIHEIARLSEVIAGERLNYTVLEAKNQLLLAEKRNAGTREVDKQTIERLLNKKFEMEKELDLLKSEKEQAHSQVWNLRASLDAVEHDLQHSRRAYGASQQALIHSERTCEQLRSQLQEMEVTNDRLAGR